MLRPKLIRIMVALITLMVVGLGAVCITWAADKPPLKIGILVPYSKVYAVLGKASLTARNSIFRIFA